MIDQYLLPVLILFVFCYAFFHQCDGYHAFLKGVKEGLSLFVQIYPTLLAMSFIIQLMKVSHLLSYLSTILHVFLPVVPASVLPMILFRPFSGSASLALMTEIFASQGVDSFAGMMASIVQGSTDTTLYVISLYFAHVQVKKIKSSLWIGLIADVAGISAAILLTIAFFS